VTCNFVNNQSYLASIYLIFHFLLILIYFHNA